MSAERWIVYGPTARDATIHVGNANLSSDGDYVAEIYDAKYARLIAAAPDMFAFVQHVADLHPDEPIGDDARALIARVRGEA